MSQFETPILYLMFNRPDLVRQTFPKIKEMKPKYLYLAADGPRERIETDILKCQECKDWVLDQIDWDCQLQTLFREKNVGCGLGPSQAITWFFENENEGIILEDDCLPNLFFFEFAKRLLSTYRNDNRVSMISGFNVCEEWKSDVQSYHFSYFGGVWGWATWKRCWDEFDFQIKKWNKSDVKELLLKNYFPESIWNARKKFYDEVYFQAKSKKPHIWDSQWTFSRLLSNSLSIVPSKNLIENIGFGANATHTKNTDHPWKKIRSTHVVDNIQIKKNFLVDKEYDMFHLNIKKKRQNISSLKEILGSIIRKLK